MGAAARRSSWVGVAGGDHPPKVRLVSPLTGVVGPLPNGLFMAYKWGLLTTY